MTTPSMSPSPLFKYTSLARSLPLLCALSCAALLLYEGGREARAEVKDGVMKRLAESDAVRHRKLMRDGRTDLGLFLGFSTGELYQRNIALGLEARAYMSDSFAIGAHAFYALNFDTSLAEQVKALRGDRVSDSSFAKLGLGAALEAVYVPAFGKASLLGAMVSRYDLNVSGGLGVVQVTGDGLDAFAPAPVVGFGARFFLSDELAVNLQLRDYIYSRAQSALPVNEDGKVSYVANKRWQNHIFLTATFSFFTGKPQTSR